MAPKAGAHVPHGGLPVPIHTASFMAISHHFVLFIAVATAIAAAAPASPGHEHLSDAEALMQLKGSFTNSSSLSSWVIDGDEIGKDDSKNPAIASPCTPGAHEWHGVVCFGGIVTGLRLSGLGLGGTIDVDALTHFAGLRSVSFANNNFSGELPALHRLPALKSIYLSNNLFSGVLPDEFFPELSHLKKLWLDGNELSGPIPETVANATSLLELHLERNAFSGELPTMPPPGLTVFDVSHNDLDGIVPVAFKKFDASKFEGNMYLCYVPSADRPCKRAQMAPNASKKVIMVFVTLIAAAAVMMLAVRMCSGGGSNRVGNFESVHGEKVDMEGLEEKPVYVKQPSSTQKRSNSWLGRRTGSSVGNRRSSMKGDDLSASGGGGGGGGAGELVIVNDKKGVFGLPDLMKAAAEVLGGGGLGSAYKAVMANGVAVVVKRARDMNRTDKEVFDAEMKRLGAMRHPNLLPPLAYHYRKDEKLLVYEYIPKGSLLYVLHGDRGMDHAALDWPMRLKVVGGIARGTSFLHAELSGVPDHAVPHGNLKSGNILLAPDFEPLLVDFGFSGLVNPAQAPHTMFAHRSPECLAGEPVSPKSDVYCLGVLLLEILTGKFPAQYLNNAKGGTDLVMWATSAIAEGFERDLFDPAILASWKFAVPDMTRLMHVAVECVEPDPQKRPDMREAAARVEEVVAASLAALPERQAAAADGRTGNSAGAGEATRSSHAAYVREGAGDRSARRATSINDRSTQQFTNAGERSARRSDDSYSYAIS